MNLKRTRYSTLFCFIISQKAEYLSIIKVKFRILSSKNGGYLVRLGLFPLNIVLFPESIYPLHIFEPRYKKLINHCLKEQEEFGIVLNNNGKMSEIGCSAKVFDLIKRYPDGKMDIAVMGTSRFNVKHIIDGEKPYLEAEIEAIKDVKIDINEKLLSELIDIYNDIVKHLGTIELNPIKKADMTDKNPSFIIAQKAGLTLQQRQILLSTLNENTRLEMLREHLIQLRPMVYKHEMIEQIIKNDGYLKN